MTLSMALPGAPLGGGSDDLVFSSTLYMDYTSSQKYVDLLAIGQSAEDQVQAIGGIGGFSLNNLEPGQGPRVSFDLQFADWQEVPSADRDQLEPGTAPTGKNPAVDRGLGGFWIADAGSAQALAAFKISDLSITPGVTFEQVPDRNGVNGIGGWQRVVSDPEMSFKIMLEGGADPLPGFLNDFADTTTTPGDSGVAKQVLVQFGATQGKTVLAEMPRAKFRGVPVRDPAGNIMAVSCTVVGTTPDHADTTALKLLNSPLKLHLF
jgi:hypothetical protein